MRRKSLILLAAMAAVLLIGCASKQEAAPSGPPAIPVIAALPQVKDITLFLESIGTLKPSVLTEVRPQIGGTLVEVMATEGQWADLGMPLFKIDPKPYLIKVQEGEAQLAFDRAALQAAEKKIARMRPLAQKDLVSQSELEELESELEKARASVSMDEARLNESSLDLERCTIKAPGVGRVGKLDAHSGLLVANGQTEPLATLSQMDPLLVEFSLTEKEFQKITKDLHEIEVTPLCASKLSKKGEMTFLDNHFDPATGLILARGKIQNPDYSLRPGQSVQVRIPISAMSKAILIPQKAIRYNQEGPYIYIVKADQTVVVRQLKLGEEQGTDQIVLEGVEPSEQLIVDGHLRISPGVKVDVKL